MKLWVLCLSVALVGVAISEAGRTSYDNQDPLVVHGYYGSQEGGDKYGYPTDVHDKQDNTQGHDRGTTLQARQPGDESIQAHTARKSTEDKDNYRPGPDYKESYGGDDKPLSWDEYLDNINDYGQCYGPPPPLAQTTWGTCQKSALNGFICQGTCAAGYVGSPKATCKGKKGYGPGRWVIHGECVAGATLTLLRTGPSPNIWTETDFWLVAMYTVAAGTAQAGLVITGALLSMITTGPLIEPAALATCGSPSVAYGDNFGTVTWKCRTGSTPGPVVISVEAPNNPATGPELTASLNFTIGTNCIGDFGEFGPCSSSCIGVQGERVQFYNITTPAIDGGRPCPFADGDNTTEACTGLFCCQGNTALEGSTILYSQDFSTDADGWFNDPTEGAMVRATGFSPPFDAQSDVGEVVQPGVCPCPGGSCSNNNNVANCYGPFTRFGQTSSPTNDTQTPFWTNLTASAPNGFVTQLAMYLDTSTGNQLVNDVRVDYSVALRNINNSFIQDFVFNIGFYTDAIAPGANTRRFVVSGSNNAFRGSSFPQNSGRSPIALNTTGWYIFQHKFYPEGNALRANLTVFSGTQGSQCGSALGVWTLPNDGPIGFPNPLTLADFGYVRYGWIVVNEFPVAGSARLTVDGQVLGVLGAP